MPREIQTEVQIANMALRILQSSPIGSFTEETLPAQTVRMYYDVVLRRCIGAHPWAFSAKESELQQFPQSPIPRWKYAYHLPTDFVKLIWLRAGQESGANIQNYEIVSGDILLTQIRPPAFIRYQYEAPVPLYPHYFIEFLVCSLVEELAAVFGHNLNTQAVYHQRIYGSYGALGLAIREERRQNPQPIQRRPSRLALARE
ncbi:MAG: hypothetical protein LBI34_01160 [Puniceicoccales bacterium]|jgi:hypothetical protein|nr:hypothetical protein [Puniceicoccales bacterium]